ncbi:MAG: hypothetical protein H0V79_04150, partial [Actinobacteria bacterium]|nr:hypothetical protein [Actinomycetota bacterium]
MIPVEVPGVIGVTSVDNTRQVDGNDDPNDYLKAYYSSYGVGAADVIAPGGDFFYGRGTESVNGLVLSTWPSENPCFRSVKEDPGTPPFGATPCEPSVREHPAARRVSAGVPGRRGLQLVVRQRPDQRAQGRAPRHLELDSTTWTELKRRRAPAGALRLVRSRGLRLA